MHEMQTIVTNACGVCLLLCLSHGSTRRQHVLCAQGRSVQPLQNYFGLLFTDEHALDVTY